METPFQLGVLADGARRAAGSVEQYGFEGPADRRPAAVTDDDLWHPADESAKTGDGNVVADDIGATSAHDDALATGGGGEVENVAGSRRGDRGDQCASFVEGIAVDAGARVLQFPNAWNQRRRLGIGGGGSPGNGGVRQFPIPPPPRRPPPRALEPAPPPPVAHPRVP